MLPYHTHFAFLHNIHLIDIAAKFQNGCFHLTVHRLHTFGMTGRAAGVARGFHTPTGQLRGYQFQLGNHLLQAVHIAVFQLPGSALLESFVWLRGFIGKQHNGIGGKTVKILAQKVFQPVAATNEKQQHEESPEDAKAREETPPLVSQQRVRNFPICVCIKSHNLFFCETHSRAP